MAELDPGLQEEADQASIDFAVAYDSDAPLSRDDAFIAGFKAAAKSRDQRIKELERATMDVILSDEYGDHHIPNHDALAALFPNIKRGYWP